VGVMGHITFAAKLSNEHQEAEVHAADNRM